MRNLTTILRVFAGVAAISTLCACEEVDPPAPRQKPVVTSVQPQPRPVETPQVAPAPTPVATPIDKEIAKEDPIVDEDETGKPAEVIAAARKALDKGSLDRALQLATRATVQAPARSAAWNTLGRVQLQMGKRKLAIASFDKAIERNPRSSFAHNNLGLALIYDKRYDEAVDALEEAVDLEPAEGYMWNNLGMAYEHLDRLEEARDAYQKATEMKNDRAQESLARLEGVKSVMRSAKAETPKAPTVPVDNPAVTPDLGD